MSPPPPHLTNGLNFLKNALMDVDGYINVYSVVGGNEEIVVVSTTSSTPRSASIRRFALVRAAGRRNLSPGWSAPTARRRPSSPIMSSCSAADGPVVIDWRSAGSAARDGRPYRLFRSAGPLFARHSAVRAPVLARTLQRRLVDARRLRRLLRLRRRRTSRSRPLGRARLLDRWQRALGLANMSDEQIEELCLDALPHVHRRTARQLWSIAASIAGWLRSTPSPAAFRSAAAAKPSADPLNLPASSSSATICSTRR